MSSISMIQQFLQRPATNVFTNQSYRDLTVNYENFFDPDGSCIDFNKPLISQIQRVSFELSNICNYSVAHKKCPASRVKVKKTLPTAVIRKVLTELGGAGYSGVIAFHRYNEPLIDPRLFYLVDLARRVCPDGKVLILTNGFSLTQMLADDLASLEISMLVVSAYSGSEMKRLSALEVKVPYKVFFSQLDDREDVYTAKPLDLDERCLAPVRDLTINVDGKIALCCLDWQNRYEFGDLNNFGLAEMLTSQEFIESARNLGLKGRHLDICRRCNMTR
jgi:radical SAM protein with 4Fe4S-binding SPASM domain